MSEQEQVRGDEEKASEEVNRKAAEARKADAERKAESRRVASERKTEEAPPQQFSPTEFANALIAAQQAILRPTPVTKTEGMDKTKVPGGVYLVNGQYVDCDGYPVAEEHVPEDADKDPLYARFHPKSRTAKDPGPGFDQFGNAVEQELETRPDRRGRRA